MQFGGVFVEFCFAIPSSESTIVSAVELVWKAMELLQLDEDRMLRAEPSLQEALLNKRCSTGNCNRKKRTGKAEVLIPAGSTLSGLKVSFLAVLFHQRSSSVHRLESSSTCRLSSSL
jgi:hypothetical protein